MSFCLYLIINNRLVSSAKKKTLCISFLVLKRIDNQEKIAMLLEPHDLWNNAKYKCVRAWEHKQDVKE